MRSACGNRNGGHTECPVLAHRLSVSFYASFPRSVALAQLHFLSLAVVSSWATFTPKTAPMLGAPILPNDRGLPRTGSRNAAKAANVGFRPSERE